MIKGIKDAKITFPNLNHITCLAHSLHRVCESIRINNEETDKFIALMKQILSKTPLRRLQFVVIYLLNLLQPGGALGLIMLFTTLIIYITLKYFLIN